MKKILVSILSVLMVLALAAPVSADGIVEVDSFEKLQETIKSAEEGVETTIKLTSEIKYTASIDIPENKVIIIDANGMKSSLDGDGSGRFWFFENHGTLTLTGNGIYDCTYENDTINTDRYSGIIRNFGELTVEDGQFKANPKNGTAATFRNKEGGTMILNKPNIEGGATSIYTEENSTLTINGGTYSNNLYPCIDNNGNTTIYGGIFKNTSCSKCDKAAFGYTIRTGYKSKNSYLLINGNPEVIGVQGALSAVGGTADVYGGNFRTIACKTHGEGSSYYAGYFAGESYETIVNIYGGSFNSISREGLHIGNSNDAPDSGVGERSFVYIKDGSFTGGGDEKLSIEVDNTENAIGKANISGGTFSSDPSAYVNQASQPQATIGSTYAVGKASIESTSKANPGTKVTLTNVPEIISLQLPAGTQVKHDDADGQNAFINGVELAPNGEIEAPSPTPDPTPERPSSPSKDLPSNTKECQKEFGDEYIWSDEYDACVIKFMIVDTSTR